MPGFSTFVRNIYMYINCSLRKLKYIIFAMCAFQKFESTESFDSESTLVENKSKFKENIELIQSHRTIKSMEIQMETLRAQCEAFEQNLMGVNELFKKECEEHGIVLVFTIYQRINVIYFYINMCILR